MSAATKVLQRLGPMKVGTFVARYWQREPVCIRQAIAGFVSPISRARLFELARDPQVESRLLTAFSGRWKLRHGPIPAAAMPSLRRAAWTLLVQGADLHDAAVWSLAARFRFLPAACFDDVMVSYASDGGGVGAHVDQYDVFLLQAFGRRRWRIASDFDPRTLSGLPLRLLADFRHQREWVLEAGDLLYLPAGIAHEGVALGPCITISIGFRSPGWQEIVEAWSERQARVAPRVGQLSDRARSPTRAPARLPSTLVQATARELRRVAPARSEIRRCLLEHLSEPKPTVCFAARRTGLPLRRFAAAARRRGVVLDLRTRMLYQGTDIAINGELQEPLPGAQGSLLRSLADDQCLSSRVLAAAGAHKTRRLIALLHDWYRFGWLHLAVN